VSKEDLIEQKIRSCGPAWYRAAARTAAVAGAFCLVVAALLAVKWAQSQRLDPIDNAEMTNLREQFSAARTDDTLKKKLRSLDLELRGQNTRSTEFLLDGAYLLLGGLFVFVVTLRLAVASRKRLPAPPEGHAARGEQKLEAMLARWSVAAAALILAAAGVSGALSTSPPPERTPGPGEVAERPALDPAKQWPRFRGPGGRGLSAYANIPTQWNGSTGEGVLWKTAVPLPGQNSPVVWGGRVFLSGATRTQREVYCFDANSGDLLWRSPVEDIPGSPLKPPKVMDATGYAAPTTATDGDRVYAIFANGDLAAFDFDGRRLWAKNLGELDDHYGHASSLTTWRGTLIVQLDQGPPLEPGEPTKSAIIAFDGATGEIEWRAERHVPVSWSSPIVIQVAGQAQLVTAGEPWVIAYDPETGAELWRVKFLSGEIGPSPTYAGGLVFVAQEGAVLAAVRPGKGEGSPAKIVWTSDENLPDTVSPASNGELVFTVAGVVVACFDAKNGKLLWDHEFERSFNSSPGIAGGLVYLMDVKGVMHVFEAGRAFKLAGTAPLGEKSDTSPAFADGRIYIRGKKHLFCIGSADGRR